MENTLYFGDNLDWLQKLPGSSVDLIYLDPPFNSKRDYNLLYKTPSGHKSEAQVQAFSDTWSWDENTERQYAELLRQPNTALTEMVIALRGFLREGDVMAYLVMMARRMVEMHRVLKDTGSLYLHCDPTASHYLKILLDAVFGPKAFRTEISWRRTSAHSDAKQGRKQYGNVRDILYFYTKSNEWTWNWQYLPYDETYIESFYRHVEEGTGRRYRLSDLTANRGGGDTSYEWNGVRPYKGRYWAYSKLNMEKFELEGRLVYAKTGMPSYKRYLDEMPGMPLQNDWQDIKPISRKEYLGYDTQKPLALLERIIAASSNPGDVVMDPFCGCGTAVHAAQKLGRKWIGIDITVLSIDLIERRLKDAFEGIKIKVEGLPQDLESAAGLAARDKYLFQDWCVTKAGGQAYRGGQKGGDGGIDGLMYFEDGKSTKRIVISVKGGGINPAMVRDLGGLLDEQTPIGVFLSLHEHSKQMVEYAASLGFFEYKRSATDAEAALYPKLQLLTVADLLDGKRPRYPGAQDATHRKARREKKGKQQGLDL
ncbi:MAG: site-specific DNA-methyltransferase [bacterium]|nr:site-specific DNA-methyltransferase [bacterium]